MADHVNFDAAIFAGVASLPHLRSLSLCRRRRVKFSHRDSPMFQTCDDLHYSSFARLRCNSSSRLEIMSKMTQLTLGDPAARSGPAVSVIRFCETHGIGALGCRTCGACHLR